MIRTNPGVSGNRQWLILLAVGALSFSLATRYSVSPSNGHPLRTTVGSHAPAAKRQHLVNNGLQGTAASPKFILSEPGQPRDAVFPASPSLAKLDLSNCLHNRPPPC
jgi:hypothetical protein